MGYLASVTKLLDVWKTQTSGGRSKVKCGSSMRVKKHGVFSLDSHTQGAALLPQRTNYDLTCIVWKEKSSRKNFLI